jgi:antitoxin component YwqK of YwqJK toxin-antitoxin module
MSQRLLQSTLTLTLAAGLSGCLAYSNVKRDQDRHPIVMTGVGATILMPGQSAPALPPQSAARYGASGPPYGAPGAGSTSGSSAGFGSASGSGGGGAGASSGGGAGYGAPPGGSNIQFIGGAELEEVSHREIKQDPLLVKALLAPVAAVAWPFKKAYQALQGEPKPVVTPAPAQPAPRGPADYEGAYEESQLNALESQLGQPRSSARGSAAVSSAPPGGAPATSHASIADELASLQRHVAPRSAPGSAPATAADGSPDGVADRVEDRNGDGRPDLWQYRSNGALVRELFDQNGDGRVDHTIRYDAATGKKTLEEEDTNLDGRIDSWTEFRDGQVARRRQDTNGDGEPDTWTLYRSGQLARVEEDRNGEGFRDRTQYYRGGHLAREVEDANGDGRPDRVTVYDASEQARERTEDLDGDGMIDARSFFEHGKLVRRELVDESLTPAPLVEEEQLGTPESFSDGSEGDHS